MDQTRRKAESREGQTETKGDQVRGCADEKRNKQGRQVGAQRQREMQRQKDRDVWREKGGEQMLREQLEPERQRV